MSFGFSLLCDKVSIIVSIRWIDRKALFLDGKNFSFLFFYCLSFYFVAVSVFLLPVGSNHLRIVRCNIFFVVYSDVLVVQEGLLACFSRHVYEWEGGESGIATFLSATACPVFVS
jgi:hypothetical protein